MAWEFEELNNTQSMTVNDNSAPQWEFEEVDIPTQTVLDDDSGEVYAVPVTFDERDTRFAIATKIKGEDKTDFFGKVKAVSKDVWNFSQDLGQGIEETIQSAERGIVGHLGDVADTALHAAYHVPEKVKMLEEVKQNDFSRWGENLSDEKKQEITARVKEANRWIAELRAKNKAFWNKGKEILRPEAEMDSKDRFVEALGGAGASIGEAVVATLATKSPTVASGLISSLYGRMRYTEYFDKALDAGMDVDEADENAVIAGTIEGGIELVGDRLLMGIAKIKPIQDLGKRVLSSAVIKAAQSAVGKAAIRKIGSRHTNSIFTQALKGFASEGGEEAAQTYLGMQFENATGVADYSDDEILSDTLFSLVVGGFPGAGTAVVGTSVYNNRSRDINTKIKKVLETETPELKPEESQVMADAVQEILFQESGNYLEEMNSVLQKELDSDVNPEGIDVDSLTEQTRKILKEHYQMSDEDINKTLKVSLGFIDARNQFNEAYTSFREGLENAGRKDINADAEARILSARAVALARAEDKTVNDILERWSLRFEQESFNEPDGNGENIYLQESQNEVNNSYGENNGKYDETNLTDKQRAIFAVRDRMVRQEPVFERRGLEDNATTAPKSDGRGSSNGIRVGLVDSVFELSQKDKEIFEGVGLPAPSLHLLKSNNQEAATSFYNAINNAKKALGAKGDSVYTYPVEDYMNMKLLLTEDGLSGIAVKPDGDIVSVFSASSQRYRANTLILAAIQNGGKKLDCFDTYLPKLYADFGFRAVARNNWVDEFAPEGWNKEFYKNFNNGEPDVVYMVYDPAYYGKYSQEDGVIFTGDTAYDDAVALQTKNIKADDKTFYQTEKPEIEIKGDFLGQFKSKEDLRKAAFDYMDRNLRGRRTYNFEIGADIEIRKTAIKKYFMFSADEAKLKAVPYLLDILSKGKVINKRPSYTHGTERNVKRYYELKTSVLVDGKAKDIFTIVKEDDKGNLFWDLQVDKKKPQTDSVTIPRVGASFKTKTSYNQDIAQENDNINLNIVDKESDRRGQIDLFNGGGAIIRLFQKADASTVIHELAHFFLDDMRKFADNETTKVQLEAIYKYVGAEDGNLNVEQHEYFARSFEAYLMDGRSPNQLLSKVFARFKKWMRSIYKTVKSLNVELTDEMRKTFDDMLGGRSLDFAMQVSGAKMVESLESGIIPPNVVNKAIKLLDVGKMSRADMDNLIEKLKTGELKRKEVNQELKKFENNNVKHNERLNPFDKLKYKELLSRGNFNKRDVIEKINRILKWSEPKKVNGKLVGRFPNLQMNKQFEHIRELMALDKDEAKQKIAENINLINAMIRGEETGNIETLTFDNKILSVAAGKAEARLLINVYNALSDSYNAGRLTTAITGEAKRKRKDRLIGEAIDVLTSDGSVDWRKERGLLKQAFNRLGISQMSWNGILDILSANDKNSQTGMSRLNRNLDVFESEQQEQKGIAEDGELVSHKLETALKGTANPAVSLSRFMNSQLDEQFVIEWGHNRKKFSKDQLIDIYMKSKDQETRELMKNDEVLQFNDEFLAQVNELLTDDDVAVANALFEFYDENYHKINRFYEDKFGTSLGKRPFYSPRSMDKGGIDVTTGELSSYAGFSGIKERTAKAGAIKIKGAFKTLNDYIVNSNHYIAFSDKLLDINAVLGDVKVKNIIRNLFGDKANKRISYEISRIASNDKVFSMMGLGEVFNKVRSNYAVSVLGLKPALAIKQLTSFPAYWEHMSMSDFLSGMADFAKHPKEAMAILSNTTLMKSRDVNIIKDFEELSKSELLKKGTTKVGLRELMMLNIKLGDRGAIYLGGWALYKSQLRKNLTAGMNDAQAKAKALEVFERVTDETQQSGRLSQQSYWQSNPFLRAFTMFQSSQNQYLRKEINAVRGLVTGRMDKSKAMKTLFIYHVLLPCLFQYAADGFRWDEKAQLKASLLGSLNGIFALSTVLSKLYDVTIGGGNSFNSDVKVKDVVPFWGSVEDLKKQFIKYAEDGIDAEDYFEVIKAFGKPLGELAGVPVKYPLDVIKNFGDYAGEGEYGKEVLLWLGWSPYALRDLDDN